MLVFLINCYFFPRNLLSLNFFQADWKTRESKFIKSGLNFIDTPQDLIDLVWIEGRPDKPKSEIKIHDVKYAGKSWTEKMDEVISRMKAISADIFVVTALDEVACKF